jgi:predicted outer membrane repeat protein
VELSGTATEGADYDTPLIGFFGHGQLTLDITVYTLPDTPLEPIETITLSIVPGLPEYIVGTPAAATVNLIDAPHPALLVTTELDVVNPGDDAMGVISLREAIEWANDRDNPEVGKHRIAFASFLIDKTFKLDSRLPVLEKNIFIDGLGKNRMTVERDITKGNFRLFELDSSSISEIEGMTLQKGYVNFGAAGLSGGGAILSRGDLTVTNCAFLENKAVGYADVDGRGGAIWAARARLLVNNCTFTSNEATFGGAIFTGTGIGVPNTNLFVENSVFLANIAYKSGGAVYVFSDPDGEFHAHAEFRGCEIMNNTAQLSGGGIYSDEADLYLRDDTDIHHNSATTGGGVYVGGGVIHYYGVWIGYNTATTGDGVYRLGYAGRDDAFGGVHWYGDPANGEVIES